MRSCRRRCSWRLKARSHPGYGHRCGLGTVAEGDELLDEEARDFDELEVDLRWRGWAGRLLFAFGGVGRVRSSDHSGEMGGVSRGKGSAGADDVDEDGSSTS